MESHFSRYSKIKICVLVFILSLSLSLTTVYGQGFQGQGSLKERLAQKGIDLTQLRERVREVMQVQNRYRDMLMDKSGVVGTGTGITPEGEAVIKVFTARAGIGGIPESLEGVRVRTKVTGKFYALQDPPPEPSRTDRWDRPVPVGVSTGHPDITAGTIGARVTDGTSVYALSNNHVYANLNQASIGDSVIQPGKYDGGSLPNDYIGTLSKFENIQFCSSWFGFLLNCPDNQIDAAIAESSTDLLSNATPSDGYGAPESTTVFPEVGQSVMKYGRTTGLTSGSIDAINATVNVGYDSQTARFVNQIIVASNTAFIQGGDSGSLLVTDPGRNPVGLLYAGNQSGTSAIANRIDLVLDRFNVTIDSGAPPSLETISVTPTSATIGIGETQQFTAIGHYSDSSTSDITSDSDVSWASSVPTVATIDPGGLATGVGAGTTYITAIQDKITSDPVALTISTTPPELDSITVTPADPAIEVGGELKFTAIGHYSDGSSSDITSDSDVSWASSVPTVATIDPGGLATGVGAGTTYITATQDEITSNQATLEVRVKNNTYMHVGDLDGESLGRRLWRAKIYITVHNSEEQPVAAAVVVGSFDDCPSGADCAKAVVEGAM